MTHKTAIGIGSTPGDGTGDQLYTAFDKANALFGSNDDVFYVTDGDDLQAAYDALPAYGGTIWGHSGDYDVGTGLVLVKDKVLSLRSVNGNATWRVDEGGQDTMRIASSGSPAALISLADGAGVNNHYGGLFEGLFFEIKHNTTKNAIYGRNWNSCRVRGCGFELDGAVTAVDQEAIRVFQFDTYGNDASWWHVYENWCVYGLFHSGVSDNLGQDNAHRIHDNVCHGHHGKSETGASPPVRLNGSHRSVVRDNVMQWYDRGIYFDDCWQCVSEGNGGDAAAIKYFQYLTNGCIANYINNPGCNAPAAADRLIWAEDGASRSPRENIFCGHGALTLNRDLYVDGGIQDDTTDQENIIWAPQKKKDRTEHRSAHLVTGTGTPEGAVKGYTGMMFHRLDGANGTHLYFKESGENTNTGWVARL
jgi:hypothetical protein